MSPLLQAAVDEAMRGDWAAMYVLSDALEEAGDPTAKGWRWILPVCAYLDAARAITKAIEAGQLE